MRAHPGSLQSVARDAVEPSRVTALAVAPASTTLSSQHVALRHATAASARVGNEMVVSATAGREVRVRDPAKPRTQNGAQPGTGRLEASTVRAVEPHPVDHRRGGWPHDRHRGCRCEE